MLTAHLPGGRGHVPREDNNTLLDILLIENSKQSGLELDGYCRNGIHRKCYLLPHRLNADALLVREEDEYLQHGAVAVICKEVELTPAMGA